MTNKNNKKKRGFGLADLYLFGGVTATSVGLGLLHLWMGVTAFGLLLLVLATIMAGGESE